MDYYKEIKEKIKNNEIYEKVKDYSKERHKVLTYFEIGRLLHEAGKHYGERIISKYATLLEKNFGTKYDKRVLFRMRRFYLLFGNPKVATLETHSSKSLYNKDNLGQKVATPNSYTSTIPSIITKLSWSHYKLLISIKNDYERNYYTSIAITNRLSVRELITKIKSKEYYRLDENTKNKIIQYEDTTVLDYVKNPILIKNNKNYKDISEKILQNLILEDLQSFLKELGESFCYIGNEYKIKLDDRYNYIDLLLFNIEYNCYIVVELKVTELKKEHIGQIELYMNYIDKNIKKITHNNTIGIIICKKDNKFVIEYCSDKRIISREYDLI